MIKFFKKDYNKMEEDTEIIIKRKRNKKKDVVTKADMLDFLVRACFREQEYRWLFEYECECKNCVITKIARKYKIEKDFFKEKKVYDPEKEL